jgi:hypothetical protein
MELTPIADQGDSVVEGREAFRTFQVHKYATSAKRLRRHGS